MVAVSIDTMAVADADDMSENFRGDIIGTRLAESPGSLSGPVGESLGVDGPVGCYFGMNLIGEGLAPRMSARQIDGCGSYSMRDERRQ